MKTQKKNSMKKYFGLLSSFIIYPITLVAWQLFDYLFSNHDFWNDWKFSLVLLVLLFVIFGGFLSIEDNKLKIYRLSGILHKRNSFEIREIHKIHIRNGGQVKLEYVVISIFNIDGEYIGGLTCQMFNFELRKLERKLKELDIKVEIDEIWGRKI